MFGDIPRIDSFLGNFQSALPHDTLAPFHHHLFASENVYVIILFARVHTYVYH